MVRHEADAEGRLEIRDLLPGSYTLLLPRGEESRLPIDFEVAAGQDLDLGDISSHENEQLRVRFVYPGDVLPEVTFRVKNLYGSRALGTLDMAPGMPSGNVGGNPAQIAFPGPGRFELLVTRTEDPKTHEALHLCALPTRFTLGPTPGPEAVVRLSAGTGVCLRPPRSSIGSSRWLISSSEGLPCLLPEIEGCSPSAVELPTGDYTISRVDPTTGLPGERQSIRVGSTFVTVELGP